MNKYWIAGIVGFSLVLVGAVAYAATKGAEAVDPYSGKFEKRQNLTLKPGDVALIQFKRPDNWTLTDEANYVNNLKSQGFILESNPAFDSVIKPNLMHYTGLYAGANPLTFPPTNSTEIYVMVNPLVKP